MFVAHSSLQKMKEIGLVQKLAKVWLDRDDICEATNVVVSADLIDVSSLFVLLLFGIGSSLIVFIGEKVRRGGKQRKESPSPETEKTEQTFFNYKGRGFSNGLEKLEI